MTMGISGVNCFSEVVVGPGEAFCKNNAFLGSTVQLVGKSHVRLELSAPDKEIILWEFAFIPIRNL